MRHVLAVALLFTGMSSSAAYAAETADDARSVAVYRAGMGPTTASVRAIRSGVSGDLLSGPQKQALREAWSSFLDYLLALDSIDEYYRSQKSTEALVISYAAFLAEYRGALEMIDAAQALPGADAVLNEPVPGIGLPADSYARAKFRFLNVARAAEFTALHAKYVSRGGSQLPELRKAIDVDSKFILDSGRGKGPAMTAANAVTIGRTAAFTAWFPVQKGVAEWMGHTRVARGHEFLISQKQIDQLRPRLEPGDVMLERREWYVSNVGLPGYWPHTALFIGSAADRARYFDDPEVQAWVREQGQPDGDLEALLRKTSHYAESTRAEVIEAISKGVSLTAFSHSAAADSLAVLRPKTSKRDKAVAVARAFGYVGLPYDFDFDMRTDSSLVCSEVVYKAYEGSLTLPVSTTMNHLTLPPNEIAHEFDRSFGTPAQQFELVVFLDGREKRRIAVPATVDDFRASWRRPKWHILTE